MPSFAASSRSLTLSLLSAAVLAACGGGSDADATPAPPTTPPTTTPPTTSQNQIDSFTIAGYPHAVEAYRPMGASRAIVFLHGGGGTLHAIAYQVFLHGGGGTLHAIAYQMGLKTTIEDAPTLDTVNWPALQSAGVIAVFPQGQSIAGNARTWRNHAMDSGQDDLAFLQALAAELRRRYGIGNVALAGHSMGGVMVNRVWCEAPSTFQSYVSISGPASSHYLNAATPCPQPGRAPYLGLFGSADAVIPGAWEAPTWTVNPLVIGLQPSAFVNPVMAGEWQAFQARAQAMCGETPALMAATQAGGASRWQACGGRLQVQLAYGAGHGIDSIANAIGQPAFGLVAGFSAAR
ncbi:hypothetical protein [Aquabacterium sp.]|uniref:hypothetical protein n=1 Tax=Aquabacterium sp. TaxID=1872578 RepID=UPI0037852DAB